MGKESRRWSNYDKKRKMNRTPPGGLTTIHDLADELLELIFLDLDLQVCLIRAASTCKRWRNVVADADGTFLRSFRSVHEPPVIGHYYYPIIVDPPCSFARNHFFPDVDPVFVPSPELAAACLDNDELLQHLSLDFVPDAGAPRELVDSRGSLLLLLTDTVGSGTRDDSWFYDYGDRMDVDLVVCEPLTRRYKVITAQPDLERVCLIGAFLLDGDDGEAGRGAISMDSFRVILVIYDPDYEYDESYRHGFPYTIVVTCDSNGVRSSASSSDTNGVRLPRLGEVHFVGRTGGRIYWGCEDEHVVILDERTLKFSTMTLPDHIKWYFGTTNFWILSGEGGTLRIVHLTHTSNLLVFIKSHGFCTDDSWVLQKSVWLVDATRGLPGHKDEYFAKTPNIIRVQEGFVVLSPEEETWLICLDLETMELACVHRRNQFTGPAYPFTQPWLPVLRACVDKAGEEERGEDVRSNMSTAIEYTRLSDFCTTRKSNG